MSDDAVPQVYTCECGFTTHCDVELDHHGERCLSREVLDDIESYDPEVVRQCEMTIHGRSFYEADPVPCVYAAKVPCVYDEGNDTDTEMLTWPAGSLQDVRHLRTHAEMDNAPVADEGDDTDPEMPDLVADRRAIIMGGGCGKTTLYRKYNDKLLDADEIICAPRYKAVTYGLRREAYAAGGGIYWHEYDSRVRRLMREYYESHPDDDRVLLCHTEAMLPDGFVVIGRFRLPYDEFEAIRTRRSAIDASWGQLTHMQHHLNDGTSLSRKDIALAVRRLITPVPKWPLVVATLTPAGDSDLYMPDVVRIGAHRLSASHHDARLRALSAHRHNIMGRRHIDDPTRTATHINGIAVQPVLVGSLRAWAEDDFNLSVAPDVTAPPPSANSITHTVSTSVGPINVTSE